MRRKGGGGPETELTSDSSNDKGVLLKTCTIKSAPVLYLMKKTENGDYRALERDKQDFRRLNDLSEGFCFR